MAATSRLGTKTSVVKCYRKRQYPYGWSRSCNFSNWRREVKPSTTIALPTEYQRGVTKLTDLLSSFSLNLNGLRHGSSLGSLYSLSPWTSRGHVNLICHFVKANCSISSTRTCSISTWNRCGQSISYFTSQRQTDHDQGRGPAFSSQSKSRGLNQVFFMAPFSQLCDVNVSVLLNTLNSKFPIRTYTTKRTPASHYDILGLTPKASQKQIKSAYYEMSKMYHPDVLKGRKSHDKFTEINEAYEILGNIQKRRLYDRGLLHERDTRAPYNPHDMDFPGTRARQSPFERGDRPPPPRGRSKIYNFDEFYKQHYNEVRERRSREWSEYMRHQEMENNPDLTIQGVSGPLLISVCLLMGILMFIMTEAYGHDLGDHYKRQNEMHQSLQHPPSNRKV